MTIIVPDPFRLADLAIQRVEAHVGDLNIEDKPKLRIDLAMVFAAEMGERV